MATVVDTTTVATVCLFIQDSVKNLHFEGG